MLYPILIASYLVVGIMILLFLIQIYTKKADVVDVMWSYNFIVIALVYYNMAGGWEPRRFLVTVIACIWSFRLGTYLAVRVFSHKGEEGRYVQLREEWKDNLNYKFFTFHLFQAAINIVLSWPFIVIASNTEEGFSTLELIGATLWGIAIVGEAISDYQLQHFKADPANKGKVCQAGLWNYSRHPNYFFQWTIWIGVLIMALSSPLGYTAAISPLLISFFLFKVTGIPMTEEQSLRSRGDAYREYQRTTSVFFPWVKKR